MKKILAGLVMILTLSVSANAAVIPYGVHNDVSYNTVVNDWGWSVVYSGTYGTDDIPMSTIFNGVGAGDYVMLAGIQRGSSTIDVLAAALYGAVTTYTARNVTHASNGAEWYYNGGSMGFAGLGDTISQSSADVNGQDERDRLSWHTVGGYEVLPSLVEYGWRSGDNTSLNSSSEWLRMVLVADGSPPPGIPEPSTFLLLGAGLIGLVAVGRKRIMKQ